MNNFANHQGATEAIKRQHRALAILRFLERETSAQSNDHVISAILDEIGLVSSREQICTCINQLECNGLIIQREVSKLVVVELTAQGSEVAQGRIKVEGVLQPFPECGY